MNNDKKNHSEKPWYKRYPAEMMLATQRLNFAQRGIFWTIQDHLWFEIHEGGLDEDYIRDICKDAEQSDVDKVLSLFFKKDGDLYYSKHLKNQYDDIIKKSESARKGWSLKKADQEQKESRSDADEEQVSKTCSISSNSNSNSNSLINTMFDEFWKSLPVNIRQRSSKPKSLTKFKKVNKDLQNLIIKTYPLYCSQQGQYAVALERYIENEKYNEVQTLEVKEQNDEASNKQIRKSRWWLAVKQGRPLYNMSITEFNNLKEEFGEHL